MSRRSLTTIPGDPRRYTLQHQAHVAEAEVFLKSWRIAQPWVVGGLAFGLATLLHYVFPGLLTVLLVAAAGVTITIFDAHLRASRMFLVARLIGPVSVAATTIGMIWLILAGLHKTLFEIWLLGWVVFGVVWVIWIMAGGNKDDVRAFGGIAHSAGLPGMRFMPDKKAKSGRKDAPATISLNTEGVLQFPAGMTMDDATRALSNLESASGSKPGSWTISPHPGDSRKARVSISDPELLDTAPLGWPGPSAEGASIAVPLRPALMQNGEPLAYSLLNHHALAMGMVGSGKSMSWCWNILAEAMTRRDFACLAADLNKHRQFLGPLEPALHGLAISDDEVLEMMTGISRISVARSEYLAKNRLTEWSEDCGLCFLDIWLEEAADVADLIKSEQKMNDFKSLIRGFRSRGMRLDMSTQRSDFEEIPTFIRSQLARVCFGVENADDAVFGLTDRQRRRGCSPQEWQARYPGKFYIDAPTIDDDLITMPMRGWFWGNDARAMEAYAATWPASDRPMDDVTGEAWEARPGRRASSGFPIKPGSKLDPRPASPPKLHMVQPGEAPTKPLRPLIAKPSATQAREAIKAQIEDWRCAGLDKFTRRDIDPVTARLGYTPDWGLSVVAELESAGVLRRCTDKRPAYWEIVAQADAEGTDS